MGPGAGGGQIAIMLPYLWGELSRRAMDLTSSGTPGIIPLIKGRRGGLLLPAKMVRGCRGGDTRSNNGVECHDPPLQTSLGLILRLILSFKI